MDRKTEPTTRNTDADPQQDASARATTLSFPARVIAELRTKIRRIFKKEDPNIYPFF